MIHTRRTDMVSPGFVPSPIQGDVGECLTVDRYTYIIWSQFEDQIGAEIEDYWYSAVCTAEIEKEPDEDPRRPGPCTWHGKDLLCLTPNPLTQAKESEYAKAELKKFIFECGRTFGVLQYDESSPLKNVATGVCAELAGLSLRAAPKVQSIGQVQRALYSQLRTLLHQVGQNTGKAFDSSTAL